LSNLEEQMDIVAPKKLKQKINCEGLLSNWEREKNRKKP
jgi:hypothetical protein